MPAGGASSQQRGDLAFDALDLTAAAVADRFLAARRSGRPAWLWPAVEPREWRAALREIGRIASRLLADAAARERLDTASFLSDQTLSVAAYTSGTGPLLGYWIERGRLEASARDTALLALHLRHARLRAARAEAQLQRLLGMLGEAGIVATLLKSSHTARRYFAEPALRPAADIDIRVERSAVRQAERLLRNAGFIPGPSQRRPYRSTWLPPQTESQRPHSLLLGHADDPLALDLHASLDRNFFGVRRLRFDRCIVDDPAERVHPAAATVRTLPQPWLVLYLACHASEGLHQLTLIRLIELVQVIRQDTAAGRLRWEDVTAATTELRCERFCYPAFELAGRFAPGLLPEGFRTRLELAATPIMRRIVTELEPATAQRIDGLSLGERLMWARGPVAHLRRAAHSLWPPEAGWSVPRGLGVWRRRTWLLVRGGVHR
jgi:hypothetical protein